ncbi:hypothetical protein MGEO_20375 [Marivita geojedonensis]|uniref:UvrD-like helicase C-terminal domain-containing protein n=2 Tax=Marivita geojedonensis TaxID=1123756 RepID=A0A1X4N8N6_9RHOB|nr:hypothetical protein MGEO_20375 [Marivita geojedonensis]
MQPNGRLIVSGRAGSGKTFAIARSVEGLKALFLAPTHQAKVVLERELAGTPHRVMTIHSAIGWKKGYDKDTLGVVQGYRPVEEANRGKPAEKGSTNNPFGNVDLVIVDELSMVGTFLFKAVEEYAGEFDLPVVYSGDRLQLPPVEDEEVINHQGFTTIVLDESVRFPKNSSIFELGEKLRDSIENRPDEPLECIIGKGDIEVVSSREWTDRATKDYASGSSMLVVTSENKRQQKLRALIRGGEGEQLRSGDIVMSKKTDDSFRNGDTFKVSKVAWSTRTLPDVPRCLSEHGELVVNGYSLSFEDHSAPAFIFQYDGQGEKLEHRIKHLYHKGKLNHAQASGILDWVEQINSFELAAFATVHKSQGRSVDTVYIDTQSVLKKPQWLSMEHHKRLLYTAITRARKRVVFEWKEGLCEYAAEPEAPLAA